MQTAVIVHGTCSRDEYFSDSFPSPSNSHWLPWLQKQFLKSGYLAFTPEMPESYKPDYALWQREFERCEISDASVLVGHSCGAGFLLRWLSENRVKIKRLVLVAPWLDPDRRRTSDFFDFSIDTDLPRRAEIHIFESLNDFSEIGQSVKLIRNALPKHVYHPFENCGHFCITDPSSPFCKKLAQITIGRPYSLRPAEKTDLSAMMKIAHEGLRPHIEKLRGWNRQKEENDYLKHFEPEKIKIIQVDGVDAGYFKLIDCSDHMFIDGIYIACEFRGRGLGTQILKDLTVSTEKKLQLRVHNTNPAQKLYCKLGFRIVYEEADSLVMEFLHEK